MHKNEYASNIGHLCFNLKRNAVVTISCICTQKVVQYHLKVNNIVC